MKLSTREIIVFALCGAIMYLAKMLMELVPNVHLTGVFVIVFTIVYGAKALYPIYIFVFLTGLFSGFAPWWIPYLYIWTVLWGVVMLLPKSSRVPSYVYMLICALHGMLYGMLYAPVQMIVYGMSFEGIIAWIVAGLPWDAVHAAGNFFCAVLIRPLASAIRRIEK